MAKNTGSGVKIGLGLAAVAAAAAGAYFFYGPQGAKNRKNLKSWAVKAKGEVMANVEKLKNVTEQSYDQAIKQVMSKYKKMKAIAPKEIAVVEKELKSSWKAVQAELKKASKNAK